VIIMSHYKTNKMKINKLFPIMAALLVVLMSSCDQNNDTTTPSGTSAALTNEMSNLNKSIALTTDISAAGKLDGTQEKAGTLEAVNLRVAGNFAILSKTGITSVYKSTITGDIGTSPITGAAIVLNCGEVTGNVFTVDAAGPACKITSATMLTAAVGDMQTAYTDAAGRSNPDFLNLGAGNIGGKTLTPGLYKWTTALNIPTDITISGSPTDVFIFQVAGTLKLSSAVRMTLAGGVQAKNIFWVVSDAVTCGTTSHFEGTILGMTGINFQTGATVNGRLLAQTAVTLQMNTVTQPQ